MAGLLSSVRNTFSNVQALRRASRSDTCVIVGNGPSLRPEIVAAIAADSADVYISNFAFENQALFDRATVLGIVNPLVVEQAIEGLAETYAAARNKEAPEPVLIVPADLQWQVAEEVGSIGIPTVPQPGFQLHSALGASVQSTVTYFLLQVAFWVGYRHVTLIGVDNTYNQPDVEEGVVITQTEADSNHFSADYFRGRRWEAANTDRMAAVIAMAGAAYRDHKRTLTNSTQGGALEVLPRVSLDTVVSAGTAERAPVRLGAIYRLGYWLLAVLLPLRSRRLLGVALIISLLSGMASAALLALGSTAAAGAIAIAAGCGAALVLLIAVISLVARNRERSGQQQFLKLSGSVASAETVASDALSS